MRRERERKRRTKKKVPIYISKNYSLACIYAFQRVRTVSITGLKKKKKRISKQDSIRDENERYEQRNMTKQYRAMIRDYKRLRVPIINNDYDDDDNDCEL